MIRRAGIPLLGLGCFMGLALAVYRPVLFDDGQFAYRDAKNFYYPLYLRVQQEWGAGRVPLWDPWESGGIPLLGNPVSAVLYPGKVIYAVMPYRWAARLYVIAHTIIAYLGMLALARSLGVSWVGSNLAGLSYAFGGPILFQYTNVIFLVGAAWVPWGLRAADRLLRQGRRFGLFELAVVLALQVLGGDPAAAYLTAVCAAGYVVIVAKDRGGTAPLPGGWKLVGSIVLWVTITLVLAYLRPAAPPFLVMNGLAVAAWGALFLTLAWRWRGRGSLGSVPQMVAGLAAACGLAAAVAAAQILPTAEFAAASRRGAGLGSSEVYDFSLDTFQVVQLFCPNFFGSVVPANRSWIAMVSPAGAHKIWVPSLYMGMTAVVLALSAVRRKCTNSWTSWMTAIAVVSLLASFGKYGGPLWWVRWGPFAGAIGAHDPVNEDERADAFLGDGIGSVYSLLVVTLPGFGTFRYPSKLLTFFTAPVAVLAGAGWDRLAAGECGRARRLALAGVAATLAGWGLAVAAADRAVARMNGRIPVDLIYGPADRRGAWAETERSLAHGAIALAAVLVLTRWAPRRPGRVGALAMVVLAADLAVANGPLVWTTPQADFEVPALAGVQIEAAERADPSPGPYRIHRMSPRWFPVRYLTVPSPDRLDDANAWERATLTPLAGLPMGLAYTEAMGNMELDDYFAFFIATRDIPVPAAMARTLGVPAGHPVFYFPRRTYDLWGARYFILPAYPAWETLERGFASFLFDSDLIYPDKAAIAAAERNSRPGETWAVGHDWQLRRNRNVYPRAWLVHSARVRPPAVRAEARSRLTESLIYMNDPIWTEPGRPVEDLRQSALIETDHRDVLKSFLPGTAPSPGESVEVTRYEPLRVELKATLERPGLVILADSYYPGWRLTIDGRASPIYRANRLMRAAAVPAGTHALVYTYEPASFRVGMIVSAGGIIALVVVGRSCWRRPATRAQGGDAAQA